MIQAPGKQMTHMIHYFAAEQADLEARKDTPWGLLWRRFVKGDDEFRKSRWKVWVGVCVGVVVQCQVSCGSV